MTRLQKAALALALPINLFAHHLSHPVMASRDDAFRTPRPYHTVADTVRVLAVMVQFQQDNNPATTGDGRLVLTPPVDSVIDAPPHNARYFRDHMTFLGNYFRKASKGRVIVRSTVLDSVFTLPRLMADYSVPSNGAVLNAANLAREAWDEVDSSGRVPDFSQYDCFVVFHAGVGHDIDLVPTLGYDPGPLDIPSLYLGINAFQKAYGASYRGIPVNNGTFFITNTAVLPETESRVLPGAAGDVLLEFSTNGLLCASVGNFLGLPDLFDTQSGASGIGRFGLEDGQSIFSFSGVFPPEPSAWEKYWLGWVAPITTPAGSSTITLPAVALADSIYRVPISTQEYFLVENRNRDPGRDGQLVTTTFSGVTRVQRFAHDTTGFASTDISALAGVVTDVEDLDWSLPGGLDADGTFFDGGTLIWHIDEAVIAQTIASDAVNANPGRRGVDLEEADGSQDIGQNYAFLSPGSGSEEGTALDFWFLGNSSPVNKNEFSPSSSPGSASSSGANSHITINNFSARGSRMSARVTRGDQAIAPLPGSPQTVGEMLATPSLTVAPLGGNPAAAIIVATQGTALPRYTTLGTVVPPVPAVGKVYAWRSDSLLPVAPFRSDGVLATTGMMGAGFTSTPAVRDTNGDGRGDVLMLGQGPAGFSSPPDLVRGFVLRDANGDSLADDLFSVALSRHVVTPPILNDSLVAVGGEGGRVFIVTPNGVLRDSAALSPDPRVSIAGISAYPASGSFVVTGSDGTVLIVPGGRGPSAPARSRNFGRTIAGPAVTGRVGRGGAAAPLRIAFATTDGYLYLVDTTLNPLPGFPVFTGAAISAPPALADLDGDGTRDIVVFSGSNICAYNYAGVSLDYFPYAVRSSMPLASAPIVGDVDGDGVPDVVGVSGDGLVIAYNRTGRVVSGFPLQAGTGVQDAAIVATGTSVVLVIASSADGSLCAWRTGSISGPPATAAYPWPQYQHDAQFSGVDATAIAGSSPIADFFPKNRAYNWPNPVYGGRTYLRYYVREDASVNIKIFDLAGDLVTEFAGPGVGGIDNEVAWNVGGVQSGVYFARIEASGTAGSGVAIVKVAVVK